MYWNILKKDMRHTVPQLVRARRAIRKDPGSSPGGVTDDFSFFLIWLASVECRRERSSTRHVVYTFLRLQNSP